MQSAHAKKVGRSEVASTDEIRRDFPALERRHAGFPVAYFDGPGGTQVPRAVGDAVLDYLYRHNANTHWAYPTSAETDAALDHARVVFATFVNASPDEIVFGANMTTLTFHLSRALGRRWGPGDEVIVTELGHHANVDPWKTLVQERGVTVRVVRMIPETGQLDWDELGRVVGARTRLVAIGGASNALGTVNDIARAAELARAAGALLFVDGVHSVPHHLADVRAAGCDFFACSAYKVYGPHVGVLYGKRDLLQSLDFPTLLPASDEPPERAETGTLNHEGIVGAAAAVEWLASLAQGEGLRDRLRRAYEGLHQRGADLTAQLWEGLRSTAGVRLYGPEPGMPRTPTVAFTVDRRPSAAVARHLADRGIFLSHGDFYAATVVERLGLAPEGLVRAGCACYTTPEEVARLVGGIRAIA